MHVAKMQKKLLATLITNTTGLIKQS